MPLAKILLKIDPSYYTSPTHFSCPPLPHSPPLPLPLITHDRARTATAN
jgi:hypothetical protein